MTRNRLPLALSITLLCAGLLGVFGCGDSAVTRTEVEEIPEGTGDRPEDPGLGFDLGCLAELPIENPLAGGGGGPGSIPAINDPVFLEPSQVDFLDPAERVFGMEVEGRFLALPVKILNYHEVVTFTVDGTRTSATWCPITFSFVELRNQWTDPGNGRRSSFGVSGGLMDNNLVLVDVETRTTWPQLLATGNAGPRAGECLEIGRNTVDTTYDLWRRLHPETLVLTDQHEAATRVKPAWYDTNPYKQYWETNEDPVHPVSRVDGRLPKKTLVYGVHSADAHGAVMPRGPVNLLEIGSTPVVLFHDAPSRTVFAFENDVDGDVAGFAPADPDGDGVPRFRDNRTGSLWTLDGICVEGALAGERLAQMPGQWVYWFAWAAFYPDTGVHRP